MTIPTGQGHAHGVEAANPPGSPLPRRASRAASNNAKYGNKGSVSDPCYCGCCKMGTGCC